MENSPQVRGRKWELKVIRLLKEWGYKKVGRTLLVNKEMDNSGVDVQAITMGKPSLNIQCKSSAGIVEYPITLHNIPQSEGVTNVIFHEKWWKGEVANTYCILTVEDFMKLINR